MTEVEIIEETLAYYKKNPRGKDPNSSRCHYYSDKDGSMCAVGRCLINPKDCTIEGSIENYIEEDLDELLQEQYRGHHLDFWQDLQHFHDDAKNWEGMELTDEGKRVYNDLIKEYTIQVL